MARERTLVQKLQSHRGSLVQVRADPSGDAIDLNGKIGLLMDMCTTAYRPLGDVRIELLIDGRVRRIYVYPHELEFIGADDAS
jgi:hypothetical protein